MYNNDDELSPEGEIREIEQQYIVFLNKNRGNFEAENANLGPFFCMAGIAENMKSSSDLMRRWASDVSNAFDVSNVVMPDMGVQYSV